MINIKDENASTPLMLMDRDSFSYLLEFLPIQDAVRLCTLCTGLLEKAKIPLFRRMLMAAKSNRSINGLGYLCDLIELSPLFRAHHLNYRHLATVLSRAEAIIDVSIKSDPSSAWKIASICGLQDAVKELLGEKIRNTQDFYGRGVMAYYALGGQLECLRNHIETYYPNFNVYRDDPFKILARCAALGGHNHILNYLRDTHRYSLKQALLSTVSATPQETLLTSAVLGGREATLKFLVDEGAPSNVDRNLRVTAAHAGHFSLFAACPVSGKAATRADQLAIAKSACRYNNLELALSQVAQHEINIDDLREDVIMGGHPKMFWHFIASGKLKLDDSFYLNKQVEHILAQYGHLQLLINVLAQKNINANNLPVDEMGRSILHYAAMGGQWHVFCYLRERFFKNKSLPMTALGLTVAHVAANNGCGLFLKQLLRADPTQLSMVACNGNTLLHEATLNGDPALLSMLIDEFNCDPLAQNKNGETYAHLLAINGAKNGSLWMSLKKMSEIYGETIFDSVNNKGESVKDILVKQSARSYFPNLFQSPCLSK